MTAIEKVDGVRLPDPAGEQRRQPHVHVATGERVDEEVPPFPRTHRLDDQRVARRHHRPPRLELDQRPGQPHLGPFVAPGHRFLEPPEHGVREFGRQRHLGAHPPRHGAAPALRRLHVGRHLVHADQFEHAAAEQERVALAQPADEGLLDRAEAAAVHQLHQHRRLGHDGADRHPVALADARVRDAMDPGLVPQHAVVLGIHPQRLAAAAHEVERPVPLLVGEPAVAPGVADLGTQVRLGEPGAERDGDQVLDQHVERPVGRLPRLDAALRHRVPRGRGLDEFERVRRHQRHARRAPRRVAAAAGALQQPRDALRAADLQHALDRQEVDAEVEARRRDHRLQPAVLQAQFDPLAHLPVERAVMQRDQAGPLGPGSEERLVPELGLRARVGEHQRGRRALDLPDDRLEHLDAEVAGPRKAARVVGQQRVDDDLLVDAALDQHAVVAVQQHLHRVGGVAEGGRQSPDRRRGAGGLGAARRAPRAPTQAHHPVPLLEEGTAALCAARWRAKARRRASASCTCTPRLVPISSCHSSTTTSAMSESCSRLSARDSIRLRLSGVVTRTSGSRLRLARALAGLGVAGADGDRPVEPEVGQRLGQRARGVRGERAHRRQPQQAQPASGHLAGQRAVQQREPDGVGLAGAGRRVQQARAPGGHVVPHFALELERLPAVGREPAFAARQRELSPLARSPSTARAPPPP